MLVLNFFIGLTVFVLFFSILYGLGIVISKILKEDLKYSDTPEILGHGFLGLIVLAIITLVIIIIGLLGSLITGYF